MRLGERAHELADGRHQHTQQLRERLVPGGKTGNTLEVIARKHASAQRHECRHELLVVPGESLDQSRSRAGVIL
jgi:hypothetical protein